MEAFVKSGAKLLFYKELKGNKCKKYTYELSSQLIMRYIYAQGTCSFLVSLYSSKVIPHFGFLYKI